MKCPAPRQLAALGVLGITVLASGAGLVAVVHGYPVGSGPAPIAVGDDCQIARRC